MWNETEPAVAKSPTRALYGPFVDSMVSMVSGMMKCRSAKPCPCAWLTAFTGKPSTKTAKSVPWSRSKPRRKYCCALPPPACCTVNRPGTVSSTPSARIRGRSASSAWLELRVGRGDALGLLDARR